MTVSVTQITACRDEVEAHLMNGIIPFWLGRALDQTYGGFVTNFDGDGQPLEISEKYLNTQCRLIWWFSTLYRTFPQQVEFKRYADAGVEFLIQHLWDRKHGGFVWKVQRDGSPLDNGKIVYGQSFAIYALSEHFLASQNRTSLDYAVRTFDLLQQHCADARYGGYLENMEADWSPAEAGFAGGDRKTLDTHMHLMESFTVLTAATQDSGHRARLVDIMHLIVEHMIDPVSGCGRNHFDLILNPIPAIAIKRTWNAERTGEFPAVPTDTTSFGHNVELAWLLKRALDTLQMSVEQFRPVLYRLVTHATDYGVDWEHGGVYRDGTADGQVLIDEKEWWQQSEVLVGFLDAFALFGEERFWQAFENVWRFVSAHMINHSVGEWYRLLDRSGTPLDRQIGNEWKVAYHTGRSMLECTARLKHLSTS